MRGILLANGPGTGELICGAYFWLGSRYRRADMRGILLAKGPGTGELICGAYFWLRVQVQES